MTWPWFELETGHLGKDSIPPGHYDRPGKFPIFREDPNSSAICKGFRDTNHMERLAERRIVASYLLVSQTGIKFFWAKPVLTWFKLDTVQISDPWRRQDDDLYSSPYQGEQAFAIHLRRSEVIEGDYYADLHKMP